MIWEELHYKNQLPFSQTSEKVLHHLKADPTVPFLIISDVNMYTMNGFEFKTQEDPDVKYKSIPFIFGQPRLQMSKLKRHTIYEEMTFY